MADHDGEAAEVQPHRSFVLRCLPVRGTGDRLAWRFSLQEAAPEARRHAFNGIAELLAFLSAELEQPQAETERDNGTWTAP